jgi:hypothetical protein
MPKKQLISITYRAVHNVQVNILKSLHNFDIVTITQIKQLNKLQEKIKSFIPKKNAKSFKKQLNFINNINLRLPIDYMPDIPASITKVSKNNEMLSEIEKI